MKRPGSRNLGVNILTIYTFTDSPAQYSILFLGCKCANNTSSSVKTTSLCRYEYTSVVQGFLLGENTVNFISSSCSILEWVHSYIAASCIGFSVQNLESLKTHQLRTKCSFSYSGTVFNAESTRKYHWWMIETNDWIPFYRYKLQPNVLSIRDFLKLYFTVDMRLSAKCVSERV